MSELFEIESQSGVKNQRMVSVLLKAVKHAVTGVCGIDSWRFVFEDVRDGEPEPYMAVTLASICGSGPDDSQAKIDTLKRHVDIVSTGDKKRQAFYGTEDITEYGGIRVPYVGYAEFGENGSDGLGRVTGNVYMSFSGAHEYIDLAVVIGVLSEFLEFQDNDDETVFQYEVSGLMKDQLISHLVGTIPFWF